MQCQKCQGEQCQKLWLYSLCEAGEVCCLIRTCCWPIPDETGMDAWCTRWAPVDELIAWPWAAPPRPKLAKGSSDDIALSPWVSCWHIWAMESSCSGETSWIVSPMAAEGEMTTCQFTQHIPLQVLMLWVLCLQQQCTSWCPALQQSLAPLP